MKFLATFLLTIVVLVVGYSLLAVTINPRGEFASNRFPNLIADILPQKQHLFHRFQSRHPVRGVLLGSSRSMKMPPEPFERAYRGAFFNFAVPNVHAEEMLFFYRWIREQGVHPRVVVIGIDVESLHFNNPTNLKKNELASLRNPMTTSAAQSHSWLQRAAETLEPLHSTFTVAYINDMARSLQLKANPKWIADPIHTFEANGYLHYPRFEAQRRTGTFNLTANISEMLPFYVDRFSEMSSLSPRREGYLEQLILDIQQDGGKVVLWITPLHPRMLATINRSTPYPKRLRELRDYLQKLHAKYGVTVYDYSDISRFGGTDTDWYDGAHVDERNVDRIVHQILEHP